MNYLLYLAYGYSDICSEAIYSILSYAKVAKESPANICIYTDRPEEFRKVLGERADIQYPAISTEQWQAWYGSRVYLLKIAVLEHAAAHYAGNLLFVDTDTIWIRDPTPIFQAIEKGQRFMHLCEGTMAESSSRNRQIYRRLKRHQWHVGNYALHVHATTQLFNDGVIGLSSPAVKALPDVRELGEVLYATYDRNVMEQLAFSMRFQVDGTIAEAAPYVLHYWNLKAIRPTMAQLLEKYHHKGPDELYERATRLDIPRLHHEELAYRRLPRWRRTMLRLMGRHWRLPKLSV